MEFITFYITTSNSTNISTLRSGVISSDVVYYLDGTSNQTDYTNTTNFNAASERYVEWTSSTIRLINMVVGFMA